MVNVLDPFQIQAIQYIKEGYSVIVAAPTGAGKTVIAEEVMKDSLREGRGVVYTAPIKALSNQKFRDFSRLFPDKVGIITGDVSINPESPLLIMTTEIFRNHILESSSRLLDKSWVIFDEIHYLDDVERGTVWEESLILLPSHMKFLALSATIPNVHSFAEWLRSVHHFPVKEIVEKKRPVPLRFYFQFQNEIYRSFKKVEKVLYGFDYLKRNAPNRTTTLIKRLKEMDRLPAIYFAFSRKKCEELAYEMERFDFLDPESSRKVEEFVNELGEKLNLLGHPNFERIKSLASHGIAFHHAGVLPSLKEIIERLFSSGFIKIIFTTETFALGINMPARTVCFDDLVKSTGKGKRPLKVREFHQMAGRAGRRGKDKEGFVYSRVNPYHINAWELKKMLYGRPEPVRSQFNASYGTTLNLYQKHQDALLEIYPLSFHYHQQQKRGKRRGLQLLKNRVSLLKDLSYIKNGELTAKGKFSSHLFGYELIFGELFEEGLLDTLSSLELTVLISGIVFEGRRRDRMPSLPPWVEGMRGKLEELVRYLRSKERRYRLHPLTKKPNFFLAPAVIAWMEGKAFPELAKKAKVDEGELIRNFRMCIQVLRDILKTESPESLKQNASEAVSKIKKGIVDAEEELREITSLPEIHGAENNP
ncbi:MAG: DEAD/DEAH box helicase [Caldiserica bacterium]|nr:DEAD/DEAH box helicase [Caldisericota bacterium]